MSFRNIPIKIFLAFGILFTFSCSTLNDSRNKNTQQIFFKNISSLCGKAFRGKMVSSDKQDADMASQNLIMHVRNCDKNKIEIPFSVGDNRSRTWVLTKFNDKLELKHNHVHENGELDKSTFYGGSTYNIGTNQRQEFPADDYSKALFEKNNIPQSKNNVWAVEIIPNSIFAYELRRENRFFRVEFELKNEVSIPPPAWGYIK